MKNQTFCVATLATLLLLYSCKNSNAYENNLESVYAESKQETIMVDSVATPSSSATVVKKGEKNIIRKADINFEVRNVVKSTQKIEDVVNHFGGVVNYTNLQSTIVDKEEQKISADSILKTIHYTVENTMTLRVPNTKLDTVIKKILKEVAFLNHRKIEAENITLQIMANTMAQKRKQEAHNRMRNAIDKNGAKLNQVLEGEDKIEAKNEELDNYALQNLDLKNQIEMSTITLSFYQPDSFSQTIVAQAKNLNYYRPYIGTQIFESIKIGWYVLEDIIAFIVKLWSLFLLLFLVWLGYKKWNIWFKKQSV